MRECGDMRTVRRGCVALSTRSTACAECSLGVRGPQCCGRGCYSGACLVVFVIELRFIQNGAQRLIQDGSSLFLAMFDVFQSVLLVLGGFLAGQLLFLFLEELQAGRLLHCELECREIRFTSYVKLAS